MPLHAQGFDEIARLLPDPLLLVSDDGRIVSVNAAAAAMCGRPAGELRDSALGAWLADEPQRVHQYMSLCARSRQPVPGSMRLRRVNGRDQELAVRCDGAVYRPRTDAQPAIVLLHWRRKEESTSRFILLSEKIAALNREIAQRKRSEAELFEQREWLRVTLASIGDAVIATDRDGRVTFMNPVAERLTGWSQGASVGRKLVEVFDIVNEQTRRPVENPTAKVIKHGHVVGLANHTLLIGRDGVARPIEDSAAPIRDDHGQILGIVLVFHDVSEQRQVEREREALLEAERAARSEAERANRIKDEFLATLSHELRTPLNAILGWAQLLRSPRSTDQELFQGLETIERNARAQTRIIEDLLDMSRIMVGKLRLDVQHVDLAGVIESAVESIRPAADAKHIGISLSLSADAGPVRGDVNRLQQVVWNLLSNAIKFTPRSGQVAVRLERVASLVELTVSDTGIGIKPDFLPHIFERFRQADASTTRQHGGLGLGLAIVRQLTEMHGGTVRAASGGEGAGAQFTVSLPLAPVAPTRGAASQRNGSGAPHDSPAADLGDAAVAVGDGPDLSGVSVLVVDDEPDTRNLLQRVLEDAGATVETADGADEGLQRLIGWRPDVLVSDIGMPGRDGYDFIRAVRRLDDAHTRATPAVALTAFARSEDRTRALLAGYQMHLAKPVETVELIAVIASLIARTRARS